MLIGMMKRIILSRHMVLDAKAVIHPTATVHNIRKQRDVIRVGANTHLKRELLAFAHDGEISMANIVMSEIGSFDVCK